MATLLPLVQLSSVPRCHGQPLAALEQAVMDEERDSLSWRKKGGQLASVLTRLVGLQGCSGAMHTSVR